MDTVPRANRALDVATIAPAFAAAWDQEMRRKGVTFVRQRKLEEDEEVEEQGDDGDQVRIISSRQDKKKKNQIKISVWKLLFKLHWGRFAFGSLLGAYVVQCTVHICTVYLYYGMCYCI